MFDKFKFWKRDSDSLSRAASGLTSAKEQNSQFSSTDTPPWQTSNATRELFQDQSLNYNNQQRPYNDPNISANPFQQQNQNEQMHNYPPTGNHAEQLFQQGHSEKSTTESNTQAQISSRDVELILSKLETIKVSIENLSHRVDGIEQKNTKNRW